MLAWDVGFRKGVGKAKKGGKSVLINFCFVYILHKTCADSSPFVVGMQYHFLSHIMSFLARLCL